MNSDLYYYKLIAPESDIALIKKLWDQIRIVIPSSKDEPCSSRRLHNDIRIEKHMLAESHSLNNLSKFLSGTGLMLELSPGEDTHIHIDQLDLNNDPNSIRNIVINFPIKLCESVTEFFSKPAAISKHKFAYVTNGLYLKPPTPVCSFVMDENPVLINTREFHRATNLSSTETRIIVSFSFDIKYSMADCIEIMKSLGYAK